MTLLAMLVPLLLAGTPAAEAAPLAPGTITVEAAADDYPPPVRRAFADAIAAALAARDFTPLPPPGRGRYLVRWRLTRTAKGAVAATPATHGPAGGLGGWGAAVAVDLPSRKSTLRPLVVSDLAISIVRRSDQHDLWHGRAVTAQIEGSRADAPMAVATKLASAALTSFPYSTDEPASVP